MYPIRTASLIAAVILSACAGNLDKRTLAELRNEEPDMTEFRVADGLDDACVPFR